MLDIAGFPNLSLRRLNMRARFYDLILLVFASTMLVTPGPSTIRGAEGPDSKDQPTAAETETQAAERKQLRENMSARIGKVKVALVDTPRQATQLVTQPLMTYTDEPLSINAATVWTWTLRKEGRPIAFCKVEHYDKTRRAVRGEWLYCFASLSPDLVQGNWPDGHQWTSSKPGVTFQDIPDAPQPGATPAARLRQMKDLSRKFAGSIQFGASTHEELRLLTQPVYSYSDAEAGVIDGAVFAAAMNGTNPTALFLIELRKDADKQFWKFAVGAMTDAGVAVKFDGKEVWSKPALHAPGKDFETWTYFFEEKKDD
jgi:hypothetical protein